MLFLFQLLFAHNNVGFLGEYVGLTRAVLDLTLFIAWLDIIEIVWYIVPFLMYIVFRSMDAGYGGRGFGFFVLSIFFFLCFFQQPNQWKVGFVADVLLTVYHKYEWGLFVLTHPAVVRWMTILLIAALDAISATVRALPGFLMRTIHYLTHPTQTLALRDGDAEPPYYPWSLTFWRLLMPLALSLLVAAVSFPARQGMNFVVWSFSRCYDLFFGNIAKLGAMAYDYCTGELAARQRMRQMQMVLWEPEHAQNAAGSGEASATAPGRQGDQNVAGSTEAPATAPRRQGDQDIVGSTEASAAVSGRQGEA
ncbi:hypothetical protein F5Y14DRAFT_456048 [Nemania sp. NC0429]|nr:hypothetical protein F5Y14DRAFT_456048 [Nemania sp. NC0429]